MDSLVVRGRASRFQGESLLPYQLDTAEKSKRPFGNRDAGKRVLSYAVEM